jgi:RNA polymerase sigma factor (sigma-70 family)
MTTDTRQLLADYATGGSEAAFRELVARYVNLVYSTALRVVGGNTQLAEDVSQTVFLGLARKAGTLSSNVMLGGWLHQHTYHVATRVVRGEQRRQIRQREAVEMNTLQDDSGAHWRQLTPVLDEAIAQLGSEDRTAIMLRYFEQQDFRAVGEALGSTQDAARVRVNRALEKLQTLLKHRGIALSAGALGSALAAGAVSAAPAELAGAITTAALAGAATGAGTTLTFLKIMTVTKLKIGITALVLAGAAATMVIQHRSQTGVRDENQALRQQIAQLQTENENLSNRVARAKSDLASPLPAPRMASTDALPLEPVPTGSLYALLTNRISQVKLTPGQTEAYLKEHRRSAASLLAAFRTAQDPALLREAMEKYPNDPQVSFEAATRPDAPSDERRVWLDKLKQSAPENAIADYLSAAEHFKGGQPDLAMQDLIAAAGKPRLQEYNLDRIQTDEEAYRAAGYPEAEAKLLASSQLAMGQQVAMSGLGRSLLDLAESYKQAGDQDSRQAALQMAVDLGQRYGGDAPGQMLVAKLLGISIERKALGAMDPNASYGGTGQTVQEQVAQLAQQREALAALNRQTDPIMQSMPDSDWVSFNDRLKNFGEEAAMRWLAGKYEPK